MKNMQNYENSDLFDPSDEDEEYCYACGDDHEFGSACVDKASEEPDESREYRGPGCSPSCGC